MMSKSQVEVRRSVWDLRSRDLEQFDLSNALAEGARQSTYGTNIKVNIETHGEPQPLPEVVEENLLRIGQEALANTINNVLALSSETREKLAKQATAHIRNNFTTAQMTEKTLAVYEEVRKK